ncbi:deoxyribodipyrimidine photolyase [Oceanicola sp. 22II-s10i]|uniref:cryptochrome/photolyase family protein n=1 Tax=Oceanicola sp. 22II-s10i TaxID=1317116 RepID=UPI000B521096|nr:cryptochrome/photolyase family protein [Oceanicola sp. 22II-s10i]OWU84164.1 deoxyribodipyrimidine photolyase [Oceanicola sp. 22II-s10i]
MVSRLVLILGDQLSPDMACLRDADRARDTVVMAEVRSEATYAPHHPKKIALIFSAMRHFAEELRGDGWTVAYTRYDDPENAGSIPGELLRRADETGATEVIATEPGEWRLIEAMRDCPLEVKLLPDDRFVCSRKDFEAWAEGRKELRMEWFYREMRRRTGYLMKGDDPAGGKWNYDKLNRKPAARDLLRSAPMSFTPDDITEEVLALVQREFPDNFGSLRPFDFAVTRGDARRALSHFVRRLLPEFGPYQDAMLTGEPYLNHALISPYLNVGLLSPQEVCDAVQAAWEAGEVPIQSAEGFIRQIIGWREFVRGVYFLEGPDYPHRNALNHQRKLPPLYWGAETRMACLREVVAQTRDNAYAHHIQRLMVTGNFALIAGIDPAEVHEWYLSVYADAFEWVEAPNTVGMSQFADGGVVGSKPYASSANYIDRMSDYCTGCDYFAEKKTGKGACPFNLLYWHFLNRHRDRFEKNHRMGAIYASWDRMDEARRETILEEADDFLTRMSRGEAV